MYAIILEDKRLVRVKQVSPPVCSKNQIFLKVIYCGICRTDAKMWDIGHRDLVLPRILGHEFCGEIDGKHYIVWPGISCGECKYCEENRENLCDNMKIMGFHRDGGFSEFVCVPKISLIPVPDEMLLPTATFAEPIGCCINAMSKIKGKRLLILGAGIMGLLLALCAKENGLDVYLYDVDNNRLELTKNIQDKIGIFCIKELNGDYDSVINATSNYSGFEMALSYVKKGGTFCFFSGISDKEMTYSNTINEIHYKEIQLIGSYGCTKTHMELALSLINKHQELILNLIDRYISPKEIEDAFMDILSRRCFKIIIDWSLK